MDYFAQVGAGRDERLADAVELLRRRRRKDGRWIVNARPAGAVYFELEAAGKPSRWVTVAALRILRWWDG